MTGFHFLAMLVVMEVVGKQILKLTSVNLYDFSRIVCGEVITSSYVYRDVLQVLYMYKERRHSSYVCK